MTNLQNKINLLNDRPTEQQKNPMKLIEKEQRDKEILSAKMS
jgi:hypothetical protein